MMSSRSINTPAQYYSSMNQVWNQDECIQEHKRQRQRSCDHIWWIQFTPQREGWERGERKLSANVCIIASPPTHTPLDPQYLPHLAHNNANCQV